MGVIAQYCKNETTTMFFSLKNFSRLCKEICEPIKNTEVGKHFNMKIFNM